MRIRRSSSRLGRLLMGTINVIKSVISMFATDVYYYGDGIVFSVENSALSKRCGYEQRLKGRYGVIGTSAKGRGCGFSGAWESIYI